MFDVKDCSGELHEFKIGLACDSDMRDCDGLCVWASGWRNKWQLGFACN
jgi:hypothetical protein